MLFPLQLNERSCVCVEPDLQMALQAGDCRHTQPILAAPSGTETCGGGGLFLLKGDISGLIGRVNCTQTSLQRRRAHDSIINTETEREKPLQIFSGMFFSFHFHLFSFQGHHPDVFRTQLTVGPPAAGHTGPSQRGRQLGKNCFALKHLEFA